MNVSALFLLFLYFYVYAKHIDELLKFKQKYKYMKKTILRYLSRLVYFFLLKRLETLGFDDYTYLLKFKSLHNYR